MITVLIVGKGNVAYHLFEVFSSISSISVKQISSRNLDIIPKNDLTILAVSDDVISEVSSNFHNAFVVHTSGSVPMEALQNSGRKGVFYMLQSFSKDKKIDFSAVPFCLEAQHAEDLELLIGIAKLLSSKIYKMDSKQRKAMHVAAVFANNFSNHLYSIASDILEKNNIPFDILLPLIKETAIKVQKLPPKEAQTGPAIRNDRKTIENHLNLLDEEHKVIYDILTQSIQNGN